MKLICPSGRCRCWYRWSWMVRWWCPHRGMALARSVFPPCCQGFRWCNSHQAMGLSQPWVAQVSWVLVMAMRWAWVNSRLVRPRSRGTDVPPRTMGMIPALQASLRASPAESRVPVSTPAVLSWLMSAVRSMLTTTVAAVAVWRWSVGRCSRSSMNANSRACSAVMR